MNEDDKITTLSLTGREEDTSYLLEQRSNRHSKSNR